MGPSTHTPMMATRLYLNLGHSMIWPHRRTEIAGLWSLAPVALWAVAGMPLIYKALGRTEFATSRWAEHRRWLQAEAQGGLS